ncbi:MAG: hypothetical protein ACLFU2_09765, partial [Opitutales bacterium]
LEAQESENLDTFSKHGLRCGGDAMKPFIGTCVSKGGSHDASGDATDRPGLRHLRFIGSDLVNGNGSPCQEEEFTLFGSASRFTDDTLLTVGTARALLSKEAHDHVHRQFGDFHPDGGDGGNPFSMDRGGRARFLGELGHRLSHAGESFRLRTAPIRRGFFPARQREPPSQVAQSLRSTTSIAARRRSTTMAPSA